MKPVKSDRISEPAQVRSVYLDRMTSSRQESDAVLERLLIGSSAGHTHTYTHAHTMERMGCASPHSLQY